MERSELLKRAIESVNKRPKGSGTIGSTNSMEKSRALKGKCGKCVHLILGIASDGIVNVGCDDGYSPINLYMKTPLGEEAKCEGYEKTEDKGLLDSV